MKTRDKLLVVLAVVGLALLGIVQGVVIPQQVRNEQRYMAEQRDPLTHDINSVLKFKHPYMGDASNLANLFRSLPLGDNAMSYLELFPEELTAEVNYLQESIRYLGEAEVEKALLYNATVAFALIGNLEVIRFQFSGVSYTVRSSEVEDWFRVELSSLLEKDTWQRQVQSKLADKVYVTEAVDALLNKSSS